MINGAPVAVMLSDLIYLVAVAGGCLLGYVPGHYARRRLVRLARTR